MSHAIQNHVAAMSRSFRISGTRVDICARAVAIIIYSPLKSLRWGKGRRGVRSSFNYMRRADGGVFQDNLT